MHKYEELFPDELDVEIKEKTSKLLVVHGVSTIAGIGAEIVRQIVEEAFDYLDGAPRVLGGRSIPMLYVPALEKACIPQKEDIIKFIKEIV